MAKRPVDHDSMTKIGEWAWNSELLWSKIDKSQECWRWLGSKSVHANLFGAYKNRHQQMTQAPRIIYREVFKQDCNEYRITHSCGNKFCVNPNHYELQPNKRIPNWTKL